ncbi:hypothetical protein [Pseudoglutamicibacter cumminsii]|uniref:hypothetical protein n=1 Tax=Pseudoglutamicibacter cumminsii TaxID=156979 RepID=UPI00195B282E|nr:hypothetical protein [Pseudoglutamicibacter cumminsii]MBM7795822.1 hypothetical protein [Pseudoglutamicibacter cumminsii]
MARIRTIKPEFWDTPEINTISLEARLTFIALLNWADDYGTGTCNPRELLGFVFPHDENITLGDFRRALGEIRRVFGVTFYKVNGRGYYNVLTFIKHQKVDKRSQPKHPGPYTPGVVFDTPEDEEKARNSAELHGIREFPRNPAEPSAENIEPSALEIGNRNVGNRNSLINPQRADAVEEATTPTAPAPTKPKPKQFAEFWEHYPRKVGKRAAETAYRNATKRTDESTILEGVKRYATDPNLPDVKFIPHAATWLNRDGWLDEPEPVQATGTDAHRFMTNTERKLHTTLQAGLAWAAEEQPALDTTQPLQLKYEEPRQ